MKTILAVTKDNLVLTMMSDKCSKFHAIALPQIFALLSPFALGCCREIQRVRES